MAATATRMTKEVSAKKTTKKATKKDAAKKTSKKASKNKEVKKPTKVAASRTKEPQLESRKTKDVEKVEVDVLSMPAHRLYSGIEKLDAAGLHKETLEFVHHASEGFLRCGALLYRMKETGAHKAVVKDDGRECATMEEYASSVLGMAPRSMYHHMRIHKTLVCDMSVDPDLLMNLGWAKAGMIAAISSVSESDGKRLLKKAEKGVSLLDLQDVCKGIRKKLRGLPGTGEDISAISAVDTPVILKLSLVQSQKEVIEKAHALFMKIEEDDTISLGRMVELLCAQLLHSNPENADMTFAEHAQLLSEHFDVDISWKSRSDVDEEPSAPPAEKSDKKGSKKKTLMEKSTKKESDPDSDDDFLDGLPTL